MKRIYPVLVALVVFGVMALSSAPTFAASPSQAQCDAQGGTFDRQNGQVTCVVVDEGKNTRTRTPAPPAVRGTSATRRSNRAPAEEQEAASALRGSSSHTGEVPSSSKRIAIGPGGTRSPGPWPARRSSRGYTNRFTNASALPATSRHPLSIVSEWPRFGIFSISVTPGLRRCPCTLRSRSPTAPCGPSRRR